MSSIEVESSFAMVQRDSFFFVPADGRPRGRQRGSKTKKKKNSRKFKNNPDVMDAVQALRGFKLIC